MKNPEITKELTTLARKNKGVLHPHNVVEAAVHPESAMHSWFEWDDTRAAYEHRLQQARELIRVVVNVIHAGEEQVMTEVFVSLTTDRKAGGGYRLSSSVLSNKGMRAQMINDALGEAQRWAEKYRALRELAKIFEAIDSAAV